MNGRCASARPFANRGPWSVEVFGFAVFHPFLACGDHDAGTIAEAFVPACLVGMISYHIQPSPASCPSLLSLCLAGFVSFRLFLFLPLIPWFCFSRQNVVGGGRMKMIVFIHRFAAVKRCGCVEDDEEGSKPRASMRIKETFIPSFYGAASTAAAVAFVDSYKLLTNLKPIPVGLSPTSWQVHDGFRCG